MNDTEIFCKEIQELKAKLEDQFSQIEACKEKYYAMLEQFKLSQQRQYTASSEKNLLQQELFDEAGDHQEAESPVEEETIEVPSHQRVTPKRKPLPENLPREEQIIDIDDSEKVCDCGCQKERFGEEITEQLSIVRPPFKVIRQIRPKYACKQCESGVSIAPTPNLLLPKSMATPSLIAFILISK